MDHQGSLLSLVLKASKWFRPKRAPFWLKSVERDFLSPAAPSLLSEGLGGVCVCMPPASLLLFFWRISFVAHLNRKQTSKAGKPQSHLKGENQLLFCLITLVFRAFKRLFALVLAGSDRASCWVLFPPCPSVITRRSSGSFPLPLQFVLCDLPWVENQILDFCEMRANEVLLWVNFMNVCVTDTELFLYTWFYFLVLLLFRHYVVSDFLRSCGLQHTRLPCPSLSWSLLSHVHWVHDICFECLLIDF